MIRLLAEAALAADDPDTADLALAAHVYCSDAYRRVAGEAIQLHGGAGVTDATPLSMLYGWHRAMRIFDGPDEAHLTTLARAELGREPLFDLPPTLVAGLAELGVL